MTGTDNRDTSGSTSYRDLQRSWSVPSPNACRMRLGALAPLKGLPQRQRDRLYSNHLLPGALQAKPVSSPIESLGIDDWSVGLREEAIHAPVDGSTLSFLCP